MSAHSYLLDWRALLGVLVFAVLTGATNLLNAYTDRYEDSLNQPFRIVWLNQLGDRKIISAMALAH